MFFQLAKFELYYFRKQPSFYVVSLIFFLLTFGAMISDNIQIGGSSNVNFNSPHAITQTMLIMSLVGMFLVANFVGGTAVRDISYKMDGMMLSAPISKTSYLWGRLTGAFLFCLLIFAVVPLGSLIGTFWPTVDAERLGDTSLLPYLWSYLVFVIPNFLFCSVLFYVFAIFARSMMGMYLGVVAFFILYEFSSGLLADQEYRALAALVDPFGFAAFSEATQYWTPAERNSMLIPLEGNLLINRLIWLGVSAATIIIAHVLIGLRKAKVVRAKSASASDKSQAPTSFAPVKPAVGGGVEWVRFWARTKFEVLQVVKSAPFIILCIISLFLFGTAFFNTTGAFNTNNWPLTRDMTDLVIGAFSLIINIVIIYYSAEVVWRERQTGIGDMVEATPTRNATLYFPKVIALSVIIASLTLVGIAFSVLYQVGKSYSNIELGLYFGLLTLRFVVPGVMVTILAVFIQVLSPNKYIGMLIFVAYFVVSLVASSLGLEHNMFQFSESPSLPYSDINAYGHFIEASLWYTLYWFGLTIAMVVVGFGLWRRGAEYALSYRWGLLRQNMGSAGQLAFALGLLTFFGSGSYIFYNTRVVNDYFTSEEQEDRQEAYERKYKQYDPLDVPTITDVYADVDFYPNERKVIAKGHYLIENQTNASIEKFLINWNGGKHRTLTVSMERAHRVEKDPHFPIAWVHFDEPLLPTEKLKFEFEFIRGNQGFVDGGSDTRVVENGSFVNNQQIFPSFGYNPGFEISDRHERRQRDLPPPVRAAKLEDRSQYGTNFIGKSADFINFETVVSTSDDQIAISPGYLQKEWTENGRRYFHYKMDAPIFNFVAYLSGRYEVTRDEHEGIRIEVYHHPDHGMNVERMITSVKKSLDYFGEQFAPYQHRQVRIIEFPRYSTFAQSFSNTIPYSENIGFIADLRDLDTVDYVTFVTAHEMAHQWWGHQLTPADVQGAAVLSESLAEYSAYMVMEKLLGKDQIRQFLKYEMDGYLRGRSREVLKEMPLYRAENQQYIHYEKGGVVMYALRDRIGEEKVNRALRNLLMEYQFASDPYPTTLDLLRYIKAELTEDDMEFVADLFERITLFDLKVKEAVVEKREDGKYQVELTIDARKFYADGQGEETEAELSQAFDIGLFAKDPDDAKGSEHVIYFEKHTIQSGENKITLEVDKLPRYAGVDPYIKMIDRNSNDNLKMIDAQ